MVQTRKQMGRPKIEIDWELFERLCSIMCTEVEIAEIFECSVDTIERACKRKYRETFADTYKKKSSKGKMSLRRKQFEIAMNGHPTMLIWLGKQHLGQQDKMEHSADFNKVPVLQLNYKLNE